MKHSQNDAKGCFKSAVNVYSAEERGRFWQSFRVHPCPTDKRWSYEHRKNNILEKWREKTVVSTQFNLLVCWPQAIWMASRFFGYPECSVARELWKRHQWLSFNPMIPFSCHWPRRISSLKMTKLGVPLSFSIHDLCSDEIGANQFHFSVALKMCLENLTQTPNCEIPRPYTWLSKFSHSKVLGVVFCQLKNLKLSFIQLEL